MRVLFISFAETLVEPFRQFLREMGCQTAHAKTAKQAALLFRENKFQVVISHFCEEQPDNIEIMKVLRKQQPKVIRLALLDRAHIHLKQLACKFAHEALTSEFDKSEFSRVFQSLSTTSKTINKEELNRVVKKIKTLPSPPKIYLRLQSLMQDPATDANKIASVIAEDPALVAKVLQCSNSSFLSKGREVTSIQEAITRVGMDTLCCIVMTAELFNTQPDIDGFNVEAEQQHSLATAQLATSLVKPELKSPTMLAGLLHAIGKLALYDIDKSLTQKFFKLKTDSSDVLTLERKIFGIDHAQLGGFILHHWGFSHQIIEAVLLHVRPKKLLRNQFEAGAGVYTANNLIKEASLAEDFISHFQLAPVLDKLNEKAQKLITN